MRAEEQLRLKDSIQRLDILEQQIEEEEQAAAELRELIGQFRLGARARAVDD